MYSILFYKFSSLLYPRAHILLAQTWRTKTRCGKDTSQVKCIAHSPNARRRPYARDCYEEEKKLIYNGENYVFVYNGFIRPTLLYTLACVQLPAQHLEKANQRRLIWTRLIVSRVLKYLRKTCNYTNQIQLSWIKCF